LAGATAATRASPRQARARGGAEGRGFVSNSRAIHGSVLARLLLCTAIAPHRVKPEGRLLTSSPAQIAVALTVHGLFRHHQVMRLKH
jgi:hypothetical protein